MSIIDTRYLANHFGVVLDEEGNALDSETDSALGAAIAAAEAYLRDYTGKAFETQDLTAGFDRFQTLELPRAPVQSISSVSYLDKDGTEQTLDSSDYFAWPLGSINGDRTYIYRKSSAWPRTYPVAGAVTVAYTAGYDPAPEAIFSTILLLAAHMYRQGAIIDQMPGTIPDDVLSLVAPYRAWAFG